MSKRCAGGSARGAVPCTGDFEPDCDADGSALAALIANYSLLGIADFAGNFGRNACP